MSAHKNHHFVPQFYLRRFSPDGRSVATLILNEIRVVEKASIRNQCQKEYFYGKGAAEEGFQLLEGDIATVLRTMENVRRFPSKLSEDHQMLMLYLASQRARTSQAAREQLQFADEFARRYIRDRLPADSDLHEHLDRFKFEIPDPVGENLRTLLPSFPLLLDLAHVFIQNQTKVGFVTSDHPVVFYNQAFEGERVGSYTGFQSRGLQIMFPISSNVALLFYDREVYSLGRRQRIAVSVTNSAEIAAINNLQYLSAENSVFFDPRRNAAEEVIHAYKEVKPLRRKEFASWREFEEVRGNTSRKIHVFIREDVKCQLKLGFLRTKQGWGCPDPHSERVRNPALCALHKQFMDEVRNGTALPGDFMEYSFLRAPEMWRNG